MYTQFKSNRHITLDWYSFTADSWHDLGGDFLCEPSPESLMRVLTKEGVVEDFEGELVIEYR